MSHSESKLIGESEAYMAVLDQVSQLTDLDRPVLVVGERGTGKELIAERLHFLSSRWAGPLVKMNCAAVNDALLESELFGHEPGAFTGATRRHVGRFERADGGTLFLDELATMSLQTQEKLLRFVEYKEFERLGGNRTVRADVRLVAATNVDLPSVANAGRFRHDLLDRLAFDVVTLPPLRQRQEDILLLAEHFAINMCQELGLAFFAGFSERARATLVEHNWPGNIRELKNAVERSVYRSNESEAVDIVTLDPFDSPYRPRPVAAAATNAPCEEPDPSPQRLPLNFKAAVAQYEQALLQDALERARYNQADAAVLLGLSYHQLRSSLRKHGLLLSAKTARNGAD